MYSQQPTPKQSDPTNESHAHWCNNRDEKSDPTIDTQSDPFLDTQYDQVFYTQSDPKNRQPHNGNARWRRRRYPKGRRRLTDRERVTYPRKH